MESAIASAAPLRIIIAEDCRISQLVAKGFAENLNHKVEIVNDGQELIEALTWDEYDVVLLDCHMPEMDGYEAALKIREMIPAEKRPRIVAVTANTEAADIQKCLDAGMDVVIAKPLEQQALAKALAREPVGIELPGKPPTPEAVEEANAPFERKAFLASLSGVEGLAVKTIDQFLETYPKMLSSIEEAIEKRDDVNSELASHRLKGAVATFRAEPSRLIAFKLEQMAKNSFRVDPTKVHTELKKEIARLIEALTKLRAKLN